jgi:GTP-dependent phosphoenolpyruvate carboxykinase
VVWCDGSSVEWQRLTRQPVDTGTFVRLAEDAKPNL